MNLQTLEEICMSCKGTQPDIKWEEHLCFVIGEKMYCMTNLNPPFHVSLKASPGDFAEFTQREGVIPAPYLARGGWIQIQEPNALSFKEWERLLKNAYALIFKKLTRKLQKEILETTPL